ncbi:unnamed protein product [Ceutorhynchus assimilis]|uniref:Uncharacterized protein n=1 Tax=Ceutorhynchus assimilis TaxID=467358 RepID=A0A9N9QE09_9CUCU|nr:unnamed protein product [Ceutorhynchus assimilis]
MRPSMKVISYFVGQIQKCTARILAVWFTYIEAIFATRKLTSDKSKYNILAFSISPELATEVRDILLNPPEQNTSGTLKKVIIKRTTLSDQSRIQKLLRIEELGEEKPSHLLRKIQQLLGEKATTDKSVIKELFLQKLPSNVKTVLAAMDDSSNLELQAEIADRVMEVNLDIQVASTHQQKNEMDTFFQHPCQCQKNNLALSKDIKEILKSLNIFSRTYQTRRTSIPKFQSSRSPTPPSSRFGKKAAKMQFTLLIVGKLKNLHLVAAASAGNLKTGRLIFIRDEYSGIKYLIDTVKVPTSESKFEVVKHFKTNNTIGSIVKVADLDLKHKILMAKAQKGRVTRTTVGLDESEDVIYVPEELTKETLNFFKECKRLRSEANYKYIWQKNGKVVARKADGDDHIVISDEHHLRELLG